MKVSFGRKVFVVFNGLFIILITLICIIPIINLLSMSFSSSQAIIENKVTLFPVDFTLDAYEYVLHNSKFWASIIVTFKRILIGVPLNVILVILAAYPLSKSEMAFRKRKFYVAYFMIAMLFNGGLMPTYYVVSKTGIIDTIWSLVLPGAVPIFSIILMMNFFRGIPLELEESARIDGAGQFTIMKSIYLPISKPSIATVTLFSLMFHWNSWFDGIIYSNRPLNYPLQSYLQTLIVSTTEALKEGDLKQIMLMTNINDTNMKAAQIFISMIPLMIIYPKLQKYFTKGLTLGSVKG